MNSFWDGFEKRAFGGMLLGLAAGRGVADSQKLHGDKKAIMKHIDAYNKDPDAKSLGKASYTVRNGQPMMQISRGEQKAYFRHAGDGMLTMLLDQPKLQKKATLDVSTPGAADAIPDSPSGGGISLNPEKVKRFGKPFG